MMSFTRVSFKSRLSECCSVFFKVTLCLSLSKRRFRPIRRLLQTSQDAQEDMIGPCSADREKVQFLALCQHVQLTAANFKSKQANSFFHAKYIISTKASEEALLSPLAVSDVSEDEDTQHVHTRSHRNDVWCHIEDVDTSSGQLKPGQAAGAKPGETDAGKAAERDEAGGHRGSDVSLAEAGND